MKYALFLIAMLGMNSLSYSESCPNKNKEDISIYYDYQYAEKINIEVKLLLTELRNINPSTFERMDHISAKRAIELFETRTVINERINLSRKDLNSIIRTKKCNIDNASIIRWINIAERFSRSIIGLSELENHGILKHPNTGYFSSYFNTLGVGFALMAARNGVNGTQELLY